MIPAESPRYLAVVLLLLACWMDGPVVRKNLRYFVETCGSGCYNRGSVWGRCGHNLKRAAICRHLNGGVASPHSNQNCWKHIQGSGTRWQGGFRMNAGVVTRELEQATEVVEAKPAISRCPVVTAVVSSSGTREDAVINTENQNTLTIQSVLTLPNDATHAHLACHEIVTKFELFNYNEREVIAVRTAVCEALSNAMQHGNATDPRKVLEVALSIDEARGEIRIKDQGAGFDPSTLPDPTLEENIGSECAGRGWLIMRHFMSQVEIAAPGNCIVLTLERGRRW